MPSDLRAHRWTGEGPCPRDGLHRLANVHQVVPMPGDRRMARPWTTDDEIRSAFLSPRKWAQACVGLGTVALVIIALIAAAGGTDPAPVWVVVP